MIPFGILSPTTLTPFLSPEKTFSGLFFFSLFPGPNKSKKGKKSTERCHKNTSTSVHTLPNQFHVHS